MVEFLHMLPQNKLQISFSLKLPTTEFTSCFAGRRQKKLKWLFQTIAGGVSHLLGLSCQRNLINPGKQTRWNGVGAGSESLGHSGFRGRFFIEFSNSRNHIISKAWQWMHPSEQNCAGVGKTEVSKSRYILRGNLDTSKEQFWRCELYYLREIFPLDNSCIYLYDNLDMIKEF